ncbi:MAG: flippase-like domain-containing protein [candidate division Zixibacteria bacterium]|nr:flippase-like domain-containing protein [candidate division Zixibacteria bacterium]
MPAFWRKKQFWGAIIGIALLGFCVKDIKVSELTALLDRVNWYYLIPAILSSFLFIALKGVRWRLMISRQRQDKLTRSVTLYSAGQVLNIVMPALTGQVGRVILFSRKQDLRKTFVFSTILLEILFDAISLIAFMLVTSFAFVFPEEYRFLSWIVASTTLLALAALYVLLHYRQNLENVAYRRLRSRWPGVYIAVKKFIRSFTKGCELLKSSQHMFGTISLSLAFWTAHMMAVWFLMLSFGFQLPFAAAAAVMIINTIVLMVPITPGNAGTFEIAVSASLAAFAVGRSDAVLFALALHLLDLLPMFTLGSWFFHLEKVSIRELKERHAERDIFDQIDEEGTFIEEEQV